MKRVVIGCCGVTAVLLFGLVAWVVVAHRDYGEPPIGIWKRSNAGFMGSPTDIVMRFSPDGTGERRVNTVSIPFKWEKLHAFELLVTMSAKPSVGRPEEQYHMDYRTSDDGKHVELQGVPDGGVFTRVSDH